MPIGAARRFFNITREDGFANFFSSIHLLAVGVVLVLVTLVIKNRLRGSNSKVVVGWGVIAGLFFFMGIDDGTVLVDGITGGFHLLSSLSSGDPETENRAQGM